MPPETKPQPASHRGAILRILLLLIALASVAWFQRPDGRLHLFFPAVAGDAVLIQTPRGEFVLIDGGADPAALANTLGKRMPFWQHDLAAIVLTAPDLQRLPGQLAIAQRYQARRALVTPAALSGGNATVREWRRILRERGTPLQAAHPGDTLDLGGATLRVLAVSAAKQGGLLLRIDYGGTSVVLAHDSNPADEAQLIGTGLKRAQFVAFPWMRDPHEPLLAALKPQSILLTDGLHSDHPPLLTYTERAIGGAKLYHERINGAIEWISDGKSAWVVTSG
jgi:beta-lactamase superfamily II metal-dependent hydrolase